MIVIKLVAAITLILMGIFVVWGLVTDQQFTQPLEGAHIEPPPGSPIGNSSPMALLHIEQESRWLGAPVYAIPYTGIDPGFYGVNPPPTLLSDDNVEIGLRADGVLVWRTKDKERGHE